MSKKSKMVFARYLSKRAEVTSEEEEEEEEAVAEKIVDVRFTQDDDWDSDEEDASSVEAEVAVAPAAAEHRRPSSPASDEDP